MEVEANAIMMATARKEVAVETTRPRVFKEPVIVMMDGVETSVMRSDVVVLTMDVIMANVREMNVIVTKDGQEMLATAKLITT